MISIELENFNIRQIMESGQCFRMDETDTDCFTVIAGKKYVEVRQKGQVVDFDCSQEDFLFFWIPYFDLDADYSRIYTVSESQGQIFMCGGTAWTGNPYTSSGSVGNADHISYFAAE